MAKKYYAVRKGEQTGIFDDWEICKALVDGFPNAEYKSFKTKKEAMAYLGQTGDGPTGDIPECPPATVIAFVDGSFDVSSGRYGYGCVLLTPDGKRTELNGANDDENARSARNVAGELAATMTAVKWATVNGYRRIIIHHDYNGIAKWYTHEWKTESYVAKRYVEFMDKYRGNVDISFEKVEAHTGVTLNEVADTLAKRALGIGDKLSKGGE